MEIVQSDKRVYLAYQTPDMPNTENLDKFKACVDVIEAYGGTPGAHLGLTKVVLTEIPGVDMSTYPSVITSDQARAARKNDCERYLAYLFISGTCNVRYGAMKIYFHNEYLKDKDAYPKKFDADLKYMNGYQTLNKPGGYNKPQRKNEESGLAFSQHSRGKATGQKHKYNNNGELHCFLCGSEDHWANNFPELIKYQQGKLHAQFENENQKKKMVVKRFRLHK